MRPTVIPTVVPNALSEQDVQRLMDGIQQSKTSQSVMDTGRSVSRGRARFDEDVVAKFASKIGIPPPEDGHLSFRVDDSRGDVEWHRDLSFKRLELAERVALLYLTTCTGVTLDLRDPSGHITSVPVRAGTLVLHNNVEHRVNVGGKGTCKRYMIGPFDIDERFRYDAVGDHLDDVRAAIDHKAYFDDEDYQSAYDGGMYVSTKTALLGGQGVRNVQRIKKRKEFLVANKMDAASPEVARAGIPESTEANAQRLLRTRAPLSTVVQLQRAGYANVVDAGICQPGQLIRVMDVLGLNNPQPNDVVEACRQMQCDGFLNTQNGIILYALEPKAGVEQRGALSIPCGGNAFVKNRIAHKQRKVHKAVTISTSSAIALVLVVIAALIVYKKT